MTEQSSLFPDQDYAVLCTTTVAGTPRVGFRKRQGLIAGYWTAYPSYLKVFSLEEAEAKVASLRYNNPKVVLLSTAKQILNDQIDGAAQ